LCGNASVSLEFAHESGVAVSSRMDKAAHAPTRRELDVPLQQSENVECMLMIGCAECRSNRHDHASANIARRIPIYSLPQTCILLRIWTIRHLSHCDKDQFLALKHRVNPLPAIRSLFTCVQ